MLARLRFINVAQAAGSPCWKSEASSTYATAGTCPARMWSDSSTPSSMTPGHGFGTLPRCKPSSKHSSNTAACWVPATAQTTTSATSSLARRGTPRTNGSRTRQLHSRMLAMGQVWACPSWHHAGDLNVLNSACPDVRPFSTCSDAVRANWVARTASLDFRLPGYRLSSAARRLGGGDPLRSYRSDLR